jgi:hypothetical protein
LPPTDIAVLLHVFVTCAAPLTVDAEHESPPLFPFVPDAACAEGASAPATPAVAVPEVMSQSVKFAVVPVSTYTAMEDAPIPVASPATTLSPEILTVPVVVATTTATPLAGPSISALFAAIVGSCRDQAPPVQLTLP